MKSHPKLHCPWIKAPLTFPYRLHGREERGVIWQEDGWFDLWFSNICYIGITCKFVKNTSSWAPPTDSGGLGGTREFQRVPRWCWCRRRDHALRATGPHSVTLATALIHSEPSPASAKPESWLVLFWTAVPPSLCLKVRVGIKQELPSVHITFPNADSELDPMLILHYISGLINWQQSQQDRT